MRIDEIYASPFLKAADIAKPVRVRIARCELGEFADQKTGELQQRIVLHFDKARKALVLNKSQAYSAAGALGNETDSWVGREIVLSAGLAPSGQPTIVISAAVDRAGEPAI